MACCGGGCPGCPEGCSAKKAERESCRTCPNRMRCHGKRTEVTEETLVRLICDAVVEVLAEEGKRT